MIIIPYVTSMKKQLSVLLFLLCVWSVVLAQHRKEFTIVQTSIPPKIDAVPTDTVWDAAYSIRDFIQQSPTNGGVPSQHTEVRMLYDNEAIYVLAMLYDTKPDSIYAEIGDRDSGDEANADLFSVEINPYNDGLNATEFMVSAAGVQMDSKNDLQTMNKSWDAVWKSEVKKTDIGWIVEMKIPFSALRFPNTNTQVWEINFFRLIKRNGEGITWNFVDKNKNGWLNQAGEMHGIRGINPPLRLSFMPYIATYYNDNKFLIKGGLDVKVGLNESFTLDMMLIPDFGQTRADDTYLNLSSVETKYDEKRQFFTEGTELFSKGDIFYSRRIGGQPRNYNKVYSYTKENEILQRNPSETNLYNATKISGHTSSGWGIGMLNANTKKQVAEIKDTLTDVTRYVTTQGVSNYNVMVVNKVIGKESYISWVNTNLLIPEQNYVSNVSGFDFKYMLKDHAFTGDAFVSYNKERELSPISNELGYRANVTISKLKGTFRYEYLATVLSDSYNPTDIGYLENNNIITNTLILYYLNYTPTKSVNEVTSQLAIYYDNLYHPLLYSRLELAWNLKLLFPSFNSIKFYISATPIEKYDHFEPRVVGWKAKEPTAGYVGAEYSSDYRKKLAFFTNIGAWKASQYNKSSQYFTLAPTYRINDKLALTYQFISSFLQNAIGYVDKNNTNDSIFFGKRDISNIENIAQVKYSLSNNSLLNLRLRHYWSNVDHHAYYLLQHDGTFQSTIREANYNTNVSALNADISYTWRFLPGSELSLVWKRYFYLYNQDVASSYVKNLQNVLDYSQVNSVSLKLIYYIDYQTLKTAKKAIFL